MLMARALDGDRAAYTRLLRELAPLLRGYFARRLFGAPHEVEDLVQETLIAIHTRRASYDRDRPFGPWLHAVARHKLIDRLRRRRVHAPLDEARAVADAAAFDEAVTARIDIAALLDALPSKQARAIRATKLDGLSVEEAARREGMSASDVKVSVHRGLKALMRRADGGSR